MLQRLFVSLFRLIANTFFRNIKEMRGEQIHRALEQSFTLERGLLQVSGLSVSYDLTQSEAIRSAGKVSDAAAAWFGNHEVVTVPSRGRQVDIGR